MAARGFGSSNDIERLLQKHTECAAYAARAARKQARQKNYYGRLLHQSKQEVDETPLSTLRLFYRVLIQLVGQYHFGTIKK